MNEDLLIATTDHAADPVWSKFYTELRCRRCGVRVVGNGMTVDPWRHDPTPDGDAVPESEARALGGDR